MINSDNSIHRHILKISENLIKNSKSKWHENSFFAPVKKLSIDKRGKVGEVFIKEVFENELKMKVFYPEDKPGDWDLKISDYKVEIKTSTLDVNNKFQHEGLKKNGDWDIIIFVDIAPCDVFITIRNKKEINWEKLHLRGKKEKATGAGYKYDFNLKNMKKIRDIEEIKQKYLVAKNYKKLNLIK